MLTDRHKAKIRLFASRIDNVFGDKNDSKVLINSVVDRLAKNDADKKEMLLHKIEEIRQQDLGQLYVTCFTNESDSIHMWAKYGDSGKGVAIGLDLDYSNLCDIEDDNYRQSTSPKLIKCRYDDESQVRQLMEAFGKIEEGVNESNQQSCRDICELSSFIKDPYFKAEHEARAITWRMSRKEDDRPLHISYLFDIGRLKSIVLGPRMEALGKLIVKKTLVEAECNSLDTIRIEESSYRIL